MVSTADQRAFVDALQAWEAGQFENMIAHFHEDVTYIVNVDGMQVPYAMSAVGKNDVRDRLGFLLHVFDVTTFHPETIVHEADHSRAQVHGVYRHKLTGEILDIRVRFKAWYQDGLMIRVEEIQDARYIEAFDRLIFHLPNSAGDSSADH